MSVVHELLTLQHFPRCLAQALFVVFCKAFPNSLKQLHEPEFIQTLCDLSSEWTTGAQDISVHYLKDKCGVQCMKAIKLDYFKHTHVCTTQTDDDAAVRY